MAKYHLIIKDAQDVELVNSEVSPTRGKALFKEYQRLGKFFVNWGMEDGSLAWVTMEASA